MATNLQSDQDLFVEYFLSRDLLHYTHNFFPLPFMMKDKPKGRDHTNLIASVRERSKSLNLDHNEFEKKLAARVRDLAKWKPDDLKATEKSPEVAGKRPRKPRTDRYLTRDPLSDLLSAHVASLQRKLGKIPRSNEKATLGLKALIQSAVSLDEVRDALVFFEDGMSTHVAIEVEDWKRERERSRNDFRLNKIFWSSPSVEFIPDGVSRYRLKERFRIGGFESAFEDFEREVSAGLFQTQAGAEIRPVAYDLCAISRSRELVTRIRPAIEVAVQHIASKQEANFWSEEWRQGKTSEDIPSVGTTAPATLALLKLSTSESIHETAIAAVKWLMEQQNTDGSWSIEYSRNGKLVSKPDLHNTLFAMEAISRSQLPGIDHSLKSARNWVMENQNIIGFWEIDGMGPASATALVLETFRYLELSRPHANDVYLIASAGLLKRSQLVSLEDSITSYRLAILAAHLALESFLYSVLQAKNIANIWADKNQTIGMRAALTAVQGWLQQIKVLKPNEIIHHRNALERLAHLRDEVVHKAAEITAGECRRLVDECSTFAREYSVVAFGYDYLD